jgi:hypothetical protein
MQRESARWERSVADFVCNYAKRNRIQMHDVDEQWGTYLRLTFKSQNQLEHFVRRGNTEFPYFEFR